MTLSHEKPADPTGAPTIAGIETLRGRVAGPVLVPGDAGYDAEVVGFNLAARQRPRVVVGATGVDDVAAAVRYAAEAGLTVGVQATGHGAGVAADGLLVTTGRMRSLTIDPGNRTARAAAGVRWTEVNAAATRFGLAGLNGSTQDVGVVGYTLGGGLGPMARTHGFAADHVRALQLVTADGTVVEVDAESEPDLFWALRGGKCHLGIVTEIEFALVDVAGFYGGSVIYPGQAAPAVLHAFGQWCTGLPERATTSVALLRLPDLPGVPEPLRGTLTVHLRYVYLGDPAVGDALLAPMRAAADPIMDLVGEMPYSAIDSVHNDPTDPVPAWDGGALLSRFDADAVDALLAAAGPDADLPVTIVEVRQLGGATGRAPMIPNAVGGRHAGFAVFVVAMLAPPIAAAVPAAAAGLLAGLQPWTCGYQANFLGRMYGPLSVSRLWPESTFRRLQQIQRTYDPHGRFRFAAPLTVHPEPGSRVE